MIYKKTAKRGLGALLFMLIVRNMQRICREYTETHVAKVLEINGKTRTE